jgi:membrane protease YdiL (CAAX protease family)
MAVPLALPRGGELLTGIALSLGAGLFEEFAFRVVLLTLLLTAFGLFLPRRWAAFLAIVCAALIFSLAHYAGELGEPFSVHTLLYRWLAGLLFTLLFYQRGFAIAAWSHALYDIWVLVI